MENNVTLELSFYASTAKDSQIRKRCSAVLWFIEGEQKVDISQAHQCSRSSIDKWLKCFKTYGLQGLLNFNIGGRPSIISKHEYLSVKQVILETQNNESPATGAEIKEVLSKQGYSLSLASVFNLLKRLKLSYQTPRPFHPKRDENKVKQWIKDFPDFFKTVKSETLNKQVEVYFCDETRYGQQGILVRQWSKISERPTRPRQIEYKNGWIIGAACPSTGAHHGLITTHAATDFMQEFLKSFSKSLRSNEHAILVLDNAGWHHSRRLTIPSNVTLHFLPPYSPDLNPIENLWKFMKSKFLCNKFYQDTKQIIETGVEAWRKLTKEIIQSVCAWKYLSTLCI